MQVLGLAGFLVAAVAVVTSLSASLYVALPKALLGYAERHGRFQGLADQATLMSGTRVGDPPARPLILGAAGAAQSA
jgi:hypothetical protein